MTYNRVEEAVFLRRPNRFIVHCRLRATGEEVTAHLPNTGRCRELLVPGARVWLSDHRGEARKTAYSLVTVEKAGLLINVDSGAPNRAVGEAILNGTLALTNTPPTLVRPEYTWGESRFDFYLEAEGERVLVEVKGVTLERGGVAAFPDAPTLRGLRHLRELTAALGEGFRCWVVFVLQMSGMTVFTPNDAAQPEFRRVLREAREAGVEVAAWGCEVEPGAMVITSQVLVEL